MASFLRQFGMREEAERSEAVVQGHDHRSLRREILTVVPRLTAGSAGEAAAVNPHHDRTTIGGALRAGPDIEIQAVFTACGLARRLRHRGLSWCRRGRWRRSATTGAPGRACATTATTTAGGRWPRDARRTERLGLADAVPLGGGLRGAPAVVAEGRCRKGNALVGSDRRDRRPVRSRNLTRVDLDGIANGERRSGEREERGERRTHNESFHEAASTFGRTSAGWR